MAQNKSEVVAALQACSKERRNLQGQVRICHENIAELNRELEQSRKYSHELKDLLSEVIRTRHAARVAEARVLLAVEEAREEYGADR